MVSVAEHAADLAPSPGEPEVAFGSWKRAVRRDVMHFHFDCPRPGSFTGVISNRHLAGINFINMCCGKHAAYRDAAAITESDTDSYVLTLQLSGRLRLTQDDRLAVLDPGMFALYDSSKPATIVASDDYQSTCIRFPKRHLDPHPPDVLAAITATPFDYAPGLSAAVWDVLISLNRNLLALGECAPAAVRSAMDLVRTLLCAELAVGTTPRADLVQCIDQHIEQHLGDPDLTPAHIARAHHISPRYLQQLLQRTGTSPARSIRRRRIERCCRDLADPAMSNTTAASIGARWGFPSPPHFSHAFKRETGRTPGEYRTRAERHNER
ncbi:helix-turn-helix domain-containing protein [Saccharopolyspora sp. HNM0983]|uniref:Helix-turn-helix domain-containing protein n=1 Tax=Saccharopolyspora montiporae TaxID=2781240 RepID=A0A929G0M2_9PSEU|nr:helix-turn-helix domain-containing protein [Saccharopolyspora sp. HNM0983]MBE9373763.1 helix-turn-helix domain-containing protein [Saccharopolyspora sp. HNM0983]